MAEPLLEARQIVKSFGRVQALRGANFTVYPQEVVALIGDNGAGKSTLVKSLVGVHPPDSGEILFEGKRGRASRRRTRPATLGIETVYQDLALAAEIDPAANMFLAARSCAPGVLGKLGFLDKAAMRQRSDEAFTSLGVRIQDTGAPRRQHVRRPAPGHRDLPRGDLGEQGRVHGRADGGARRRADPQRARPDQARARARASRSC